MKRIPLSYDEFCSIVNILEEYRLHVNDICPIEDGYMLEEVNALSPKLQDAWQELYKAREKK